ncbi:MAG: hypothetical protein LBQ92_00100, partial [Propionibacteriaceae bacterium]|nr:hypothetical protein [Propionibacteriaceae bacterium]
MQHPTNNRPWKGRLLALGTALALGLSLAPTVAPPAVAAPGGLWETSFETTDPAAYDGLAYEAPTNVTGFIGDPASLQSNIDVSGVTGNHQNSTSEGFLMAVDTNPSTKWLANSSAPYGLYLPLL